MYIMPCTVHYLCNYKHAVLRLKCLRIVVFMVSLLVDTIANWFIYLSKQKLNHCRYFCTKPGEQHCSACLGKPVIVLDLSKNPVGDMYSKNYKFSTKVNCCFKCSSE